MGPTSIEFLTAQVELSDQLSAGREAMLEPQDLPGRFGRAVRAINRLLEMMGCESVLAGGWAVWRHGFSSRLTQDIDIVLPADRVEEFLRVASVAGFEILPQPEGRWPKVLHKESTIKVDILPEGARPGTRARLAPTTIPHPSRMGAAVGTLKYITFPALIELKLAAGRAQDVADVLKLIRENPERAPAVRLHLATVHADYVAGFERLSERAADDLEQ